MAMREPGFLQTPFAQSGERAAIPQPQQPGGQISFAQGWGPDYEKALGTDPQAKAIDRQQTNQLFYLTTLLLQRWQTESFPEWIEPGNNGGNPYPYPLGAVVRVPNGASWAIRVSTKAVNTSTPSATEATADWADLLGTLQGAILGNTTAIQTMLGALRLAEGSTVEGTVPPFDASDRRIASLEWVRGNLSCGTYSYNEAGNTLAWELAPAWMRNAQGLTPFTAWGTLTHLFGAPNSLGRKLGNRYLPLRDPQGRGLPFAPATSSPVSVILTPQGVASYGTAITGSISYNVGSGTWYLFSEAVVEAALYPDNTACNFIIKGFKA